MEAKIQAILEKYTEYLATGESSKTAIISASRIPALAFEIAQLVEPDKVIADNMRDYWINKADGAER